MHKKFKSIAKKSGFIFWKDEPWNRGEIVDWGTNYDNELQTYGKLVVEECCKIMLKSDTQQPTVDTAKKIKEYFGIE